MSIKEWGKENNIAFDFNPTVDRIRVIGQNGNNYRLNPLTGGFAAADGNITYAAGDPNAGNTPSIGAAFYTNSYIATPSTGLYVYDVANNLFAFQNPPNDGILNTIGQTGIIVNDMPATIDMDAYFDAIGEQNLQSMMLRQYIVMDTFISVQSLGDSLNIEKEDIERELGDVQEVSQYVQELEATRKYLENIVRRMIRLREQASGRRYSEIIEKARDYIGQNYMSENISLNLVASSVNISPSYFSSLFSQEVGSTFVEYLTGVRMEKAKELLMCSDKRTSDIGYEVGYKDSHYFSYIFKKTQGCSPKEFRSRGRG